MDSRRIHRLYNAIQTYAWGSHTAIQELLGLAPTEDPWAELWMGAHPSAPSRLLSDAGWTDLDAWIARDPEGILGADVAKSFDGRLPFLFKLLAAELPLSIQAHPNLAQARAGFASEDAAGVPFDDRERCYRDDQHKPEIVCALTPFHALKGFRAVDEILERVGALGAADLEPLMDALAERDTPDGVRAFLGGILGLAPAPRGRVLARLVERAKDVDDPALRVCGRLAEVYPDDVGALAPLLLNQVELAPGEAMFVQAGELHSYLGGFAVELMANSDNVLRGGLTSKHVDVPKLLAVLTGRTGPAEVLHPRTAGEGLGEYQAPVREFSLSVLLPTPGRPVAIAARRGIEILLCTRGAVRIATDEQAVSLTTGVSVVVPAQAGPYRVEGDGALHRATAGSD